MEMASSATLDISMEFKTDRREGQRETHQMCY